MTNTVLLRNTTVWGWIKKEVYNPYYLRRWTWWNLTCCSYVCQRAPSVHGHVSRGMCTGSTAVAVQLGDQLGKLVPRRSRRSYTPFVVFSETLWFSPPWQCPTAHTAQQTCNLLQNLIGKRWTISHTVQIWHPVIFICSPSWRSTC